MAAHYYLNFKQKETNCLQPIIPINEFVGFLFSIYSEFDDLPAEIQTDDPDGADISLIDIAKRLEDSEGVVIDEIDQKSGGKLKYRAEILVNEWRKHAKERFKVFAKVLFLTYVEGYVSKKIAEILGCSRATIYNYLSEAHVELHNTMNGLRVVEPVSRKKEEYKALPLRIMALNEIDALNSKKNFTIRELSPDENRIILRGILDLGKNDLAP
jgi:predicted DNA-binding protein YlxM (UPF0122 family)